MTDLGWIAITGLLFMQVLLQFKNVFANILKIINIKKSQINQRFLTKFVKKISCLR